MCAVAASPILVEASPLESEPVLRLDIIEMPNKGKVSTVTGNVERLSRNDRWIAVKSGYRLQHGDQVKVGAGATLIIKFSGKERVEFSAAPRDRWLRFEIAKRPGHDT